MTIQFNTDNNITGSKEHTAPLIALLSEGLSRFSSHITRLEIHLADVDGNKDGLSDIRCMLEARLEGMKPIAVTNHANTHEQAVTGAMAKLKTSLNTILGRQRDYQHS
jgi:hypothetical protein